MNIKLQRYLRESFPEYSDLTVLEIFQIKHVDLQFMESIYNLYGYQATLIFIMNDLFFIDLSDFFVKYKEKYVLDFIDETCFGNSSHSVNGKVGINYNLYNSIFNLTSLYINCDMKKNEIMICYNDETIKYNTINVYKIIFKYLDFIKKEKLRSRMLFSFIYGYIIRKTDLTKFFDICLLNENKIQIQDGFLFSSKEFRINNFQQINLEYKKYHLYILDKNSNILLKRDLRLINKTNFLSNLIEPLKDILVDIDNSRQINFQKIWEQDVYYYLSTFIDKKDTNVIKTKIHLPKLNSTFLNKIVYSQRPLIDIHFILNDQILSSYCMRQELYYIFSYAQFIVESYESYKMLAEKIELQNLINSKEIKNHKKRI